MALIEELSIFGKHNGNENRVTDALLQIIYAGGEPFVDYLLQKCGKKLPENKMVVETQYKSGNSVLDGCVSCKHSYTLFIESKLGNDIRENQMNNHLRNLKNNETGTVKFLIYVTKGPDRPDALVPEILWYSWEQIYIYATEYETEERLFRYLVNQFRILLESLNIIDRDADKRVIIVPGLIAEGVAYKYHFYACQEKRSFAPAKYIAFYKQGRINYLFEIEGQPDDSIAMKEIPEIAASDYAETTPGYNPNEMVKYFSLSFVQNIDIQNDTRDANGNNVAYVQRQRYTTLEKIQTKHLTSEL